jgi:hypothetical protein
MIGGSFRGSEKVAHPPNPRTAPRARLLTLLNKKFFIHSPWGIPSLSPASNSIIFISFLRENPKRYIPKYTHLNLKRKEGHEKSDKNQGKSPRRPPSFIPVTPLPILPFLFPFSS